MPSCTLLFTIYNANGVNLGAWLAKERTHDPIWWVEVGEANALDEWTLCETLGRWCGPVLNSRYGSFLNFTTIDVLASVGVNTLRIPTTYAAWIKVPGSQFYSGYQVQFLDRIVTYAVQRYNMHIILGLHSLPGGYSPLGLDKFTISPPNEASDTNLVSFGSPAGLTDKGAAWVNSLEQYLNGVLDGIKQVDPRIPMMLQDNFKGAEFWASFYNETENIVIDSHVYYFASGEQTYANFINPAVCGQAQAIAQQTKFPNYIGEWSLQTEFNNTFAGRESVFNAERYAFNEYNSGSAFWTAVSYSTTPVAGQGTQRKYWSYVDLINQGVIKPVVSGQSYC
ncbi:glycoside hydrolase family 5 protein [Didymella exigua CBS 183.55]|uniref:glucan 1,3-beta-glucosidase n=1 Tax=Didymella exigua CBS 183.55 TaxID=1150837 RepID=A0A6A5S291_9PLEO|nr:glycoside hydrolase family 5 protein [Didymella exigua CBS 183.55]KAF1931647.1 glycoside hydrolase family 5 protein [Didymella exigua CBS 183.55]